MSVSIMISGSSIQIAEGTGNKSKANITKVITVPVPLDSMAGGAVTDDALFAEYLKKVWEENRLEKKKVSLTINTRVVSTQSMQVPKASKSTVYSYVKREFNKFDDENQDDICSYLCYKVNSKEKTMMVMASKIEKAEMTHFLNAFALAGISLSSVRSTSSVITMTATLPVVKGKTCIIQVCDGQYLIHHLYVNGEYQSTTSNKVFQEHGEIAYAIEAARSISNILQFMKAHDMEYDKMHVYLTGFDKTDAANITDSIFQMNSEIETEELRSSEILMIAPKYANGVPALLIASGFWKTGAESDFLPEYEKARKEKSGANVQNAKYFIAPVAAFVVFGLITGGLKLSNMKLENELDDVKSYNMTHQPVADEYDSLDAERVQLIAQYDSLKSQKENIASYPLANSEVTALLEEVAEGYAEVAISSYTADTGVVGMVVTAEDVDLINQYIDHLRLEKIVKSVVYTGYDYVDQTNLYQVKVTCALDEMAGKPETEESQAEADGNSENESGNESETTKGDQAE